MQSNRCVHCSKAPEAHDSKTLKCPYSGNTTYATMALPQGLTCTDCGYFRFCIDFCGRLGTETQCDWYPIRFTLKLPETVK